MNGFVAAELLRRSPADRRLLAAVAIGNGAIAAVWLISRTVGLPFGPERFEAEAAGLKDVLATSAEILILVLAAVLLSRAGRPPRWSLAIAWGLAALGLLAALAGGGH